MRDLKRTDDAADILGIHRLCRLRVDRFKHREQRSGTLRLG